MEFNHFKCTAPFIFTPLFAEQAAIFLRMSNPRFFHALRLPYLKKYGEHLHKKSIFKREPMPHSKLLTVLENES